VIQGPPTSVRPGPTVESPRHRACLAVLLRRSSPKCRYQGLP
jgi:hypothetical protein